VKAKTACPAVAHLHRREVPPALMFEQGYRLVISFLAVDLHMSYFGLHRPQSVMASAVRSSRQQWVPLAPVPPERERRKAVNGRCTRLQ
jgi:hypothetical protein